MATELSPVAKRSWQLLIDRARIESDPRKRANLEIVAEHVQHEVRGDIAALMATLVAEPSYEIWGSSDTRGPSGYDEVRQFYEAAITIGKNRLEYEIARVVVDDDHVVTEGIFRHAYSGKELVRRHCVRASDVDPLAWYLVEHQALILWPISLDGLIEGEHVYAGEPPRIVRQLRAGEYDHLGPVDRT